MEIQFTSFFTPEWREYIKYQENLIRILGCKMLCKQKKKKKKKKRKRKRKKKKKKKKKEG